MLKQILLTVGFGVCLVPGMTGCGQSSEPAIIEGESEPQPELTPAEEDAERKQSQENFSN